MVMVKRLVVPKVEDGLNALATFTGRKGALTTVKSRGVVVFVPTPGPCPDVIVPASIVLEYTPAVVEETLKITEQLEFGAIVPLANVIEFVVEVMVPPH